MVARVKNMDENIKRNPWTVLLQAELAGLKSRRSLSTMLLPELPLETVILEFSSATRLLRAERMLPSSAVLLLSANRPIEAA